MAEATVHLAVVAGGQPQYGLQDHERYTCNGSVDLRGNPASRKRTGNWRACYSILGGEFCGALAYYAVGTNLVSYLIKVQKKSNVAAASNIASWQGTCYLTPLLGAFLADSYWGRHRTIVISLMIFTIGMVLLTLSAVLPASMHTIVIPPQELLPSLGLFLTALGLGGMWPCVPTFGADQFDDTDGTEKVQKELYYNWYFFAVNGGFFIASTLLVWVQINYGWGWGFGIPTLFSATGIAGFLACMKLYRYQKPGGSALTRICQVVVAASRKINVDVPDDSSLLYEMPGKESAIVGSRKLLHTDGLRFFDRAATITASDETSGNIPSPWKLCTVTQVEELKVLARMLPVLLAGIIFNTAEAFFPLFIEQGQVMDNDIDGFSIPPATLTTFNCLSALVEMVRLNVAKKGGLMNHNSAVPMNILWQGPQYFFIGVAKVFTVVGFIEFVYEQSPDAMRSLCQACSLIMITLGSYLVSVMLKFINSVTGERGSHGWIPENLNEGHLDRFFWLMAGLQLLNVLVFGFCASRYKRKLAS
ncbi:protein NRT1/ PTR FAMILY 8.3-like [Panicum miliaceum]|uniref:Protein NRT1/ PTR FAMILY 8.3-like n=1 Tax=Panicum miliaceum TaxID=4540 RepID=A0A3L6TPL3_PANMI|nr:protein NRT1/ PTR FAMILY 8.3-like [Panicum miliaceum]